MTNTDRLLGEIKIADQGKARKDVLILGAGIAGLVAGYELVALGHPVKIVEGSRRVGGRAWTHRFSDGQYHELGAMRIPATHDLTRHYVDKMRLKLRPFVTANKNAQAYYYIRGVRTRIIDAPTRLFKNLDLYPSEQFTAASAVAPAIMGLHFADLIASLTPADEDALFARGPTTQLSEWIEQRSLGDFLQERVRGKDARELIGVTTGLEVMWDKALSMFLRDEIAKTGDDLSEIVGGTDQLPMALAKSLPEGTIRLETEVVEIEAGTPVKVRLRSAACGNELIEADHVICTLPFPVLRRIRLRNFGLRKLAAIRNLNYASSTKVLLHCKQRFWETDEGIYGGASLSDEISRSTYYPSDNAQPPPSSGTARRLSTQFERSQSPLAPKIGMLGLHTAFSLDRVAAAEPDISRGPGVLVGSYNWARDARRLGELSYAARAECVVAAVSNIHPQLRDNVDDHHSIFWDEYPWAGAAFAFPRPNDMRDSYADAIRPEGSLHFAGEHCSTDQAWMQGAATSALRAVREIVGQ